MRRWLPFWIFLLLLTATFAVATVLQPRAVAWDQSTASGGVLKVLLGDSRKLFADQLLEQADVSFHRGYYPSIFDERKAPKDTQHMKAKEGTPEAEEHEQQMSFMGPPRDWIERFGRHFMVTEHTHLEAGKEREILPWLRLSVDLDPHRVDTYTVASYWLRNTLGKVNEAERFLREGLRNNPGSYEIWFELGLLYFENRHDLPRARNALELALKYWQQTEPNKAEPDLIGLEHIVVHLAKVEEEDNKFECAIGYLKMVLKTSPNPQAIQQRIEDLEQKLASGSSTNSFNSADGH